MTNIQLKKALFRLPNGTYVTPYTDCKGAIDIGDIGQALHVDESLGLRRKLNGQTITLNSNTAEFFNKIRTIKNTYPSLFCTDIEYNEIASQNYLGECGKFVLQEQQDIQLYAWGHEGSQSWCYTLSETPKMGDAVGIGAPPNIDWVLQGFPHSTPYVVAHDSQTNTISIQLPNETQTQQLERQSAQDTILSNQIIHTKRTEYFDAVGLNKEGTIYSNFSEGYITPKWVFHPIGSEAYLKLKTSLSGKYTLVLKVRLDTTANGSYAIIGNSTGAPSGNGFVIRTDNNLRLYMWGTTDGTNWNTTKFDTGIDLVQGWQYIKLTAQSSGDTYILSTSQDGITWTDGNAITGTVFTEFYPRFGRTAMNAPLKGAIDLGESYIQSDIFRDNWIGFEDYNVPVDQQSSIKLPKIITDNGPITCQSLSKMNINTRKLIASEKANYSNNYQWYNLYNDGWCEQGGPWNASNGQGTGYQTYNITFTIPYKDTSYSAMATGNYTGGDLWTPHANNRTNTGITFYRTHETANYNGASWYSCGYALMSSALVNQILADIESTCPYFIQIAQGQHTMTTIRNEWEINNPYTIFDAKQSQYPLNNTSWLKSLGQWNEKTVYTYAYEALLVELNNSIETNTTVDLPSGGKYTKHLQTVNFDVNKVVKVGSPVIEEGILTPSDANYVQLKVGENILNTAKSWQLDLLCQISSNYIVATDYDNDYVPFAINNNTLIINNSLNTFSTIAEGWKYLRVKFNDSTGYEVYTSDDGNAFDLITSVETVDKVDYADNNLNLKGTPVDLRTVQFKYDLGDGVEHLVTTGVEYKSAVWNKLEHTTSEADYAYNFIVDTVNESFRLPLYDRVFNNPYAELYYYIGDTLQNTSLIDIGRLSDAITNNKSEIAQLRTLISQIAGDIPTVETSTYGVRNITLYNGIDLGDHIIDLSSYIPLDGHQYDIHLFHYMNVGDTSASNHNINIYNADKSQLLHRFGIDGIAVQGSSSANNGNFSYSCCVPLPANSRTIVLNLNASGDKQFSQYYVQLVWFRKY